MPAGVVHAVCQLPSPFERERDWWQSLVPWPGQLWLASRCRQTQPNATSNTCLCLQVKLLEAPGQALSIAAFLGKAVEPPLQQSITSAIQVGVGAVGGGWRRRGRSGALRLLCRLCATRALVHTSLSTHAPPHL